MKKGLTFDKFEILCDRLDKAPFKCGNWWPTIDEVKSNIEPKLEQNLEFLIWIANTANEPQTDEQRESRRYINNLIYDTINANENKRKK